MMNHFELAYIDENGSAQWEGFDTLEGVIEFCQDRGIVVGDVIDRREQNSYRVEEII